MRICTRPTAIALGVFDGVHLGHRAANILSPSLIALRAGRSGGYQLVNAIMII
ncbi:MAG: hypothetical protein IKP69_08500 [Oscillospiraceae bacterium]|nr:hypothetical protein [Oscillospiraceae bacterium]